MTFTIDTRNIKDHQTVCYKPKTNDGYPYADATHYLAIGAMAIGISEITKANYKEVYARHKFELIDQFVVDLKLNIPTITSTRAPTIVGISGYSLNIK